MNNMRNIFSILRKELYSVSRLFHSQYTIYKKTKDDDKTEDVMNIDLIKALASGKKDEINEELQNIIEIAVKKNLPLKSFVVFLEKNIIKFYDKILNIAQLTEVNQQVELSISTALNEEQLALELTEVLWAVLNPNIQNLNCDEVLDEISSFIKLNHKSNISLGVLSKEFAMSSPNLSKKFKNYFGVSIPEFINIYRVELAKEIMDLNRSMLVKEVSIAVGYNDQYYFSKTFKKIVGIWPSEYGKDVYRRTH
ncbi:MAG: helix-turn-helix transcriptional regulator [Lachnospirales bacterium]